MLLTCSCGKSLRLRDSLAGRRVKCPACQSVLTAPSVTEGGSEPALIVSCRCGKKLRGGRKLAGQRVLCPACGAAVDMPEMSAGATSNVPQLDNEEDFKLAAPVAVKERRSADENAALAAALSRADGMEYGQRSVASETPIGYTRKQTSFRKGRPIRQKLIIAGVAIGIGYVLALPFFLFLGLEDPGAGLQTFGVMGTVLAVLALVFAGVFLTFEKAGYPGWYALIPIMNVLYLFEIANIPKWWVVFLLIPIANFVVLFIMCYGIARNFGHDVPYALGLFFITPVMWVLFGFSNDRYIG